MRGRRCVLAIAVAASLLASACVARTPAPPVATSRPPGEASSLASGVPGAAQEEAITFAVIGDYGMDDAHERAVADLVASWDPGFIVTTGDDYYAPAGGEGTGRYDESTGRYYCRWLKDVKTTGSNCRVGEASKNAFFPSLGNHDYTDTGGVGTYLDYFRLPGKGFTSSSGNERYYDFVQGPVHFFVLNSNPEEPDGTSEDSKQARWLRDALSRSRSPWNFVVDHHPPYSSDNTHGSTAYMQWPFGQWGADVVLSGHAHDYERVMRDSVVYLVNGAGGAERYSFGEPVEGSEARFTADWGAQKVTVDGKRAVFEFYDSHGTLIDRAPIAVSQ